VWRVGDEPISPSPDNITIIYGLSGTDALAQMGLQSVEDEGF